MEMKKKEMEKGKSFNGYVTRKTSECCNLHLSEHNTIAMYDQRQMKGAKSARPK